MIFQFQRAREQTTLDISNNPLSNFPSSDDPRDSLRKNIIKPRRNFNAFKSPSTQSENDSSTRSLNMFQTGIIENVNGPAQNCSSCGGAK